jgi:hypothetical protein
MNFRFLYSYMHSSGDGNEGTWLCRVRCVNVAVGCLSVRNVK